jgi:hypothetical protein
MRDRCPHCGSNKFTVLPAEPEKGPTYRCEHGHFFTNPAADFADLTKGAPVAFWMPREAWEKLPVFQGSDSKPEGEAMLYRDPDLIGVVHRWLSGVWWQARLSFEPQPAAKHPF